MFLFLILIPTSDDPLERDLDDSDESSEGDEDDVDDEDDTEELMKELQRIKKERMEEQARKEAIAAAEREKINISGAPFYQLLSFFFFHLFNNFRLLT